MIVLRNALLVVVLVLVSGCAAMYNPHPQVVPVDSVPPRASVYVDGEFRGVTPLMLDLDNRSPLTITLRHLDWREQEVVLERRFDGASLAMSIVPEDVVGSVVLFADSQMASASSPGAWLGYGLVASVAAYGGTGVAALSIVLDAATGRWYRLAPDTVVIVFDD